MILLDADGGHAHLLRANEAAESPNDIAWSPDGRRLLIMPNDLMTIDLRARVVRDLGEGWYSGSEDVWALNSIAWQPLPR